MVDGPDWDAAEDASFEYWARLTPAEKIALADELRKQTALTQPSWPSEAERQEDLDTHIRVARDLARASARLASRSG